MNEYFEIGGIKINNFDYSDVLERIQNAISEKTKVQIITVNPEIIVNAFKNKGFYDLLKNAEIRTADGIGIVWASDYLSKTPKKGQISRLLQFISSFKSILLPKNRNVRVTGTDLLPEIAGFSQNKGWKIFLLGAREGIAEIASKNLQNRFPNAIISGFHSGSPDEKSDNEICRIIDNANPDILLVAYGSPKQEFWINRNLNKLNSVKVAIGVGGAFDFHSGKIKRAPNWMRKIGLEWLWRLILQPNRIKRIWNATFVFMRLMWREKNKKAVQ